MLRKCADPYLAMLIYRSTPLQNGYSSGELLVGRKLCTTLHILPNQLEPSKPDYSLLQKRESDVRTKQQQHFNSCHRSRQLVELYPGDSVYVNDGTISAEGKVVQQVAPRSYQVNTSHGSLRRNCKHLQLLPISNKVEVTRSGRVSRKPLQYRL